MVKENMGNRTELTLKQKAFMIAYEKHMGMVSKACRELDLCQSTFYKWKETCPLFKESLSEADVAIKDWGESALHGLINGGNPAAILFYNKTKNKDRGYVEKREIEHSQSEPISINVIMPEEDKE